VTKALRASVLRAESLPVNEQTLPAVWLNGTRSINADGISCPDAQLNRVKLPGNVGATSHGSKRTAARISPRDVQALLVDCLCEHPGLARRLLELEPGDEDGLKKLTAGAAGVR
jgi:hypothetical protein